MSPVMRYAMMSFHSCCCCSCSYQERGLFHHLKAKWNGTEVKIIATPPGYGIVAPPLLRLIFECAGIKDATGMVREQ